MVFCCSVCQERLENPPDVDEKKRAVCATRCGHVFHFGCINRWWHYKNAGVNPLLASCPVCRKMLSNLTVFELFPSTREISVVDISNSATPSRIPPEVQSELQELKKQLADEIHIRKATEQKLKNAERALRRVTNEKNALKAKSGGFPS